MDSIKEDYLEFRRISFPEGLAGCEINGIDLVILDSTTAGLIEKYIYGKLSKEDYNLLKESSSELNIVTKKLDETSKTYFTKVLNILIKIMVEMN